MNAPSINHHEFETRFADLLSLTGSVRLRAGEPESVERSIAYLEADPAHWGSGYACAAAQSKHAVWIAAL